LGTASTMTIDVGMLEIVKRIVPGAFSRQIPYSPEVAFIDGQLKLQIPDFIRTWETFLAVQFVTPINRLYDLGATVVVLSFDFYPKTPGAKQPTQRKRTTKLVKLPWDQREELPSVIPENYSTLIANRAFKVRVCQLVVSTIASLVTLGNGRRLIIDYDDMPLEFTAGDVEPQPRTGYTLLDESDVKFPQYLLPGQSFLADSVDGDYVAIAMMQIERARAANETPPKVLIRRIEIKSAGEKRPRSEGPTRRQYEFVDGNMVVDALVHHLRSNYVTLKQCKGHEIRLFCYLVALIGCDFTSGIPRVGPTTLWKHLEVIWVPLQNAYAPDKGEFNVRKVADTVIAPLLKLVHKKHAGYASGQNLTGLLNAIKASSALTDKARSAIPSVADIACLVRNSNWTIHYWWDAVTVPSSSQAKYGFAIKAKNGEVERDPKAVLD
jgi:hypothetical protein